MISGIEFDINTDDDTFSFKFPKNFVIYNTLFNHKIKEIFKEI